MAKSSNNRRQIDIFLILFSLIFFQFAFVHGQDSNKKKYEEEIAASLKKNLVCTKIEARIETLGEKPQSIKNLAIIIDNLSLGQFKADRMTVIYENPVIDVVKLKKGKGLQFISYTKNKVSILASTESLQKYVSEKSKQFNKKNVQISLKFTPPYVECFYSVPVNEIASESVQLLKSFIRGDKIEGYAAFTITAKKNALYAYSSKVIVNHFLIPNVTLDAFQDRFNPFDEIPVVRPFEYTINNITIQSKYIFMTN
jgi:hypothetical protein